MPLVAVVCVIVPHGEVVVVAVSTAPVPVGLVSTMVGGEVDVKQPEPIPAKVLGVVPSEEIILDGTPLVESMVPVTTQLAPPPVEVNGVDAA